MPAVHEEDPNWRDLPDPAEREQARLRSLAAELTALRKRVEAELGEEDVAHIRRLRRTSQGLEATGRVLIHLSLDPVTWGVGVGALWLHKQLETIEIGHTCLHGAYDGFAEVPQFHRRGFVWDCPIDEASWHVGHNLKHHQHTNIAGKDPDIHFGPVRLTEHTPRQRHHRSQLFTSLFILFPHFTWTMNWHFSGLNDVYKGNGMPAPADLDVLLDRSPGEVRAAHERGFRKYVPYFAKNYLFYPALAGPMFLKVLAGNVAADFLRDVWTAATIFCGHVGEDVAAWPVGTRASGKGSWFEMQVQATQNFTVPAWLAPLCGGLECQIEHHLFPRLTPRRLRQIAPEVQAICEAHDVSYQSGPWASVLRKSLARIAELGRPEQATEARRPRTGLWTSMRTRRAA